MRVTWRNGMAFVALLMAGLGFLAFGAAETAAQTSASLSGLVTDATGAVDGVSADLFTADADGNRSTWLGSNLTGTAGPGRVEFDVEPGCYAVTVIAPQGRRFTTGSQWATVSRCVTAGETTNFEASLRSTDAASAEGMVSNPDGEPVDGVTIDLFRAQADGARGSWLSATTTGADGNPGSFRFDGLSGCYVLTFVAADEFVMTESGTPWLNRFFCAGPGETVGGLDAEVRPAGEQPMTGLVALVVRGEAPVAGVAVDLFADDGAGGRSEFITSAATDPDGVVSFTADPGCFIATFVAPTDETWAGNGSPWLNASACVEAGQVTDLGSIRLTDDNRIVTLDIAASRRGDPVGGVGVDVFAADASGSRGEYVTSGVTIAGQRTRLDLDLGNGCWVVTLIAPEDDFFQENGTRWINRPFCTVENRFVYRFDAALDGGSTSCASGAEFRQVFRDDFNGNTLSPEWNPYNSIGNAGFGLRRPSAVTVEDGLLVISADMEDGTLVSGGLSHDRDQRYGKYAFRVRTDEDPSRTMSGEVLTWPTSGVHPRDGENNIYSTLVQTEARNPFFSFIHKPFGSVRDQEMIVHNADASRFQIMTMEWTPDRITITREGPGGELLIETNVLQETQEDLIPDVPHGLNIQLDAWGRSVPAPVQMEIDWVEVYEYCG